MSLSTRIFGVSFFLGLIAWGLWAGPTASSEPGSATLEITKTLQTKPIAEIRLGERVLGRNPDREEVQDLPKIDPTTWREVHLTLIKPSGQRLQIELLRPTVWLEINEAAVGGTVFLSMAELGAFGEAKIIHIGPCPPLDEGPGEVVTGRFIHESDGELLDLYIEGEPHPIGCTANHPFWSETHKEFVPAEDLTPGETLQTASGQAKLTHIEPRGDGELVYNLEVHREHVYRVGQLGTLVHNNYSDDLVGPPGSASHKSQRWKEYQERTGTQQWTYERWSNQYDRNMENYVNGLDREAVYRSAMGGENRQVNTVHGQRQLDVFIPDEKRILQMKTGKEYLTNTGRLANSLAIKKDQYLVSQGYIVEWVLEKGGSKPLIEALRKAGIKVHIGPTIP